MPNTTSASLKLTVQATGENSGTWGQITNTNLLILEQAIGGYAGVALNATTGATLTFSNGALSDGKNQVLKLTGTITTNVDVIVPDSVEKTYVVENATSGAFTVTVKTTSGSGVTWGTTDKGKKLIYSDGTDILEGISSIDTLKVSTFTSTGIDDNATSTAITIDSSENVGIGTASPAEKLDVYRSGSGITTRFGKESIFGELRVGGDIVAFTGTRTAGTADNAISGYFINNDINSGTSRFEFLTLKTVNTERMRIDSSGNVLVGATSDFSISSSSATGVSAAQDGALKVFRDGFNPLYVGRQSSDGSLVEFRQAGSLEGTISVSGGTVSYNGFTGTHWSRFIDESKPDVLRGTVMESLDQMTDWYHAEFETSYTEQDKDGNDVVKITTEKKPYALKANEQEGDVITYAWNTDKKDEEGNDIIEQVQATIVKEVDVKHVMSKISDTVEAKNVYGVFSAWDNDDLINNDFYVASVGSYVVRIKAGQVVAKGDLLQSNGDGTAKVQADDIIRASTFAKVLSNTVIETYEDGSFIVPCSLMC